MVDLCNRPKAIAYLGAGSEIMLLSSDFEHAI